MLIFTLDGDSLSPISTYFTFTRKNIMSFWKKMFKKTKKENNKHHEAEMRYFRILEKRMAKLEKKLKKKKK